MPTKIEKDAISGTETTGHEWDGIRELNTPLPKWWLYVLYATIAFAVGQMILFPSVPYGRGYFHGLLGYSQRAQVQRQMEAEAAERATTTDRIAKTPFDVIRHDPELMAAALAAGRTAFADDCRPCHGAGGGGRPGYPALAAGAWIWGGTLPDIEQTVTHGIRSSDPDARESQMPRFGADGILTGNQIDSVADFVWIAFYGHPSHGANISAGAKLFADNCAVCHGALGQGEPALGAPRLASHVHLYGDDRNVIVRQVTDPHMGVMPNWNHRLSPGLIRSLALYVHSLGGGQ